MSRRSRRPAGLVCPRRAGANAHRFRRFGQAYWQCRACRAQTSLRAGTVARPVIEPVPAFTETALADWATRRLAPGAEVYSDGLGAFRA